MEGLHIIIIIIIIIIVALDNRSTKFLTISLLHIFKKVCVSY